MPEASVHDSVDEAGGGCVLRLTVQPGRDAVRFPAGYDPWRRSLVVHVQAAPADGAANRQLVDAAAAFFGVDADAVAITAGAAGRRKRLRVTGVGPRVAARRLAAALAE